MKSKFQKRTEKFGKEEKLKFGDKSSQETEEEPSYELPKSKESFKEEVDQRLEKNFWEALNE